MSNFMTINTATIFLIRYLNYNAILEQAYKIVNLFSFIKWKLGFFMLLCYLLNSTGLHHLLWKRGLSLDMKG